MAIIDELIAILGYDIEGEGNLARFNKGLDRAESHARSAAQGIGVLGVAAGSFIGAMAFEAVTKFTRSIASLPGDITNVGSTFEKLQTTLTTIEGSSEKAKSALDWVQSFAATTPYELNEVANAFVRMRAYGLDPMSGQLQTIGNAASAMGKGLMQGVEAVADAAQGENERLKEFGIRAKVEGQKVTYSWQQNGKEMSKTVKKNGTEIVAALSDIFSRFDGAMEAQSKTWEGMTSNMADMWTGFLKKIADAGYYEDVKRRLRGVLEQFNQWNRDGTLDGIAKAISKAMTETMRHVERVARHVWDIGKAAYYAADAIVSLTSRLTGLDKSTVAGIFGVGALASSKLGRAALMGIAKRVPMVAVMLLIDDIMTGLRNPADSYIGSLVGGAEAFAKIKSGWDELSDSASKLADTLERLFGIDLSLPEVSFGEWIDAQLLLFLRDMDSVISDLTTAINALNTALEDPGKAWEKFVDVIIAQLDRLLAAIDEKLGGVLSRLGIIKNPNIPEQGAEATKPEILNTQEYVNSDPTRTVDPQTRERGIVTDKPAAPPAGDVMTSDARDLALRMQQEEAARIAQPSIIADSLDAAGNVIRNAVEWLANSAGEAKAKLASGKGDRVSTMEPPANRFGGNTPNAQGMDQLRAMLETANANLARMTPEAAVNATITDSRQDNRQFPVTVQTNITQNIQQSTDAPGAAAKATGAAVGAAATSQATRIEQEPAF
jgi:hypothetical protein